MRTFKALLLAGGAALMLTAAAQARPLPQPQPCPKADAAWMSAWPAPDPALIASERAAFADFDRIAARMEQRMAAMMRHMAELERIARSETGAGSSGLLTAGSGFCARSVEITRTGDGPPRVVRRSWGDCGEPADTRAAGQSEAAGASVI